MSTFATSISRIAIAAVLAGIMSGTSYAQGVGPITIAKQGYFFVGGKYYDTPQGQVFAGQSYVEFQIPKNQTHRYPIVMVHGAIQTGTNFTGTPDGRKGWAQFFVERGYAV